MRNSVTSKLPLLFFIEIEVRKFPFRVLREQTAYFKAGFESTRWITFMPEMGFLLKKLFRMVSACSLEYTPSSVRIVISILGAKVFTNSFALLCLIRPTVFSTGSAFCWNVNNEKTNPSRSNFILIVNIAFQVNAMVKKLY